MLNGAASLVGMPNRIPTAPDIEVALLTRTQLRILVEDAVAEGVRMALKALPSPESSPELVSNSELAERLGVSKTTLWRWRKRGLRSFETGSTVHFLWTDVEAFLADGSEG